MCLTTKRWLEREREGMGKNNFEEVIFALWKTKRGEGIRDKLIGGLLS